MAMNFWEAQRKARSQTTLYLCLFVLFTLIVATASELALRYFSQENYAPSFPFFGLLFLILTFGVASYNYAMYNQYGGSYVAESVGGRQANPDSLNPRERQLINIVEEMALATSLPIPLVYIVPSNEINAFAAGLTPQAAAIAVTQGTLEKLNRDETQGVIAHEFGHIHNGDMVINLRLAAMIMGFFFMIYLGFRLLSGGRMKSRDNGQGKGGNPVLIAALIFIMAGAITWLVGSLLQACVSRQREFLADASAVQFTRNPDGIINALRKIAKDSTNRGMPITGTAYSHLYFEDRFSLFSTHPSLRRRIAALEGKEYLPEESIEI